tara:strand:- start:1918 stop:3312 length:1395 start_codon:yes stop_codon:yes gene_type:complete
MFSKGAGDNKANLMRLAVEASPNGMVVVDTNGRIILINSSIEALFGYSEDELLNQPIEILVPERFTHHHPVLRNEYFVNPVMRAMGHGRDLYGMHKNGSEIPVEIGLNPISLDGQTLILAAIVDITERKRSQEMIRLAVEAAPNGMVMTDANGRITMVNSQIESLFGYSREELMDMSIDILVPDRFRKLHPQVRSSYYRNPISRSMGKGRDLFALHKDGKEFPVEIGLNPLHTDMGTMILASVVDITERKQQEESLKAALKEKEILLSEIHHRVKNNLQIIDSLIGIQSEKVIGEKALGAFQESQNRVRSIAMIHQILYESQDFSKVEIASVINGLVDNLIQSYGIDLGQIGMDLDLASVHLPIDKSIPLGLIINEIVTNTLKHAFPEGRLGRLYIKIKKEEFNNINLTIEDTGVGIPQDFSIEESTSLGLQLIQTLVDQLGGTLEIRRKDPTRFHIVFPENID